MKIKNLPEFERPVEKSLYEGVSALSNSELVAIIIGSGLKEKSALNLAEELISRSEDGLYYLADSSAEELMQTPGIGEMKAARLMASFELGKRVSRMSIKPNQIVTSSADIAGIFMDELRLEKKEYLKILLLNTQGGVITVKTVSIGTLTQSLVHPREVFNEAVRRSACAIALVHNHPSGNPNPSEYDRQITDILVEGGKILGINVVDHIIIGDKGYFSFRDEGIMG